MDKALGINCHLDIIPYLCTLWHAIPTSLKCLFFPPLVSVGSSICQIPMQLGFLFGCPRTSTVRAATHCELVMLNRADLDRTLESYPLIAR